MQFGALECETDKSSDNATVTFTLNKVSDAVNDLVLLIDNPKQLPLNALLVSIKLLIGGQTVDRFDGPDIGRLIDTVAALWNRKVEHIGRLTFVPLPLAMVQAVNLLPLAALTRADAVLEVKLKEGLGFREVPLRLWGNKYVVGEDDRKAFSRGDKEMLTSTVQLHGVERVTPRENTIRLYFEFPVTQIAFWGLDKSRLKRVQLKLNSNLYLDQTPETLEFQQRHLMPVPTEATVIFLSQADYYSDHDNSVNMTAVANIELVLETDETADVCIAAVSLNIGRVKGGAFSLAWPNSFG